MEDFGSWMEHKVLQWHDFGFLPASQTTMVSHFEHMVSEVFSKNKIIGLGLWVKLVWRCQSRRQLRVLQKDEEKCHTGVQLLSLSEPNVSIFDGVQRKIKQKLMNSQYRTQVTESRICNYIFNCVSSFDNGKGFDDDGQSMTIRNETFAD